MVRSRWSRVLRLHGGDAVQQLAAIMEIWILGGQLTSRVCARWRKKQLLRVRHWEMGVCESKPLQEQACRLCWGRAGLP